MSDNNNYYQQLTQPGYGQPQYVPGAQQYAPNPPQQQYIAQQTYSTYSEAPKPQVVVSQINLPSNLNDYAGEVLFHCPMCNADGMSQCKYEAGSGTYCCTFMLCFLGCLPGLIPCYVDSCKNRTQVCRSCSQIVGTKPYKPC